MPVQTLTRRPTGPPTATTGPSAETRTNTRTAAAASAADDRSSARRWLILAVLAVAQLMVVLDTTVVNIALPSAPKALGFSDADRQWIRLRDGVTTVSSARARTEDCIILPIASGQPSRAGRVKPGEVPPPPTW